MRKVLLVNDDGIMSPGLRALIPVLERDFDLTIVAPTTQKSWIGKASSYHQKIRCDTVDIEGIPAYALDGTPSDCVSAGIYHLCPQKPDLVISGINVGANVGDSYILSSGTVGGAIEAALANITAIAVGVEFDHTQTKNIEFNPSEEDVSLFSFAAILTRALAHVLLSFCVPNSSSNSSSVPQGMVFNLNMESKASPESEIIITSPARYSYNSFLTPSENGFYHSGAAKQMDLAEPGSDIAALREGKISLSPLSLLSPVNLGGTEEKLILDSLKTSL